MLSRFVSLVRYLQIYDILPKKHPKTPENSMNCPTNATCAINTFKLYILKFQWNFSTLATPLNPSPWAREYVGDPPSARNVLGSNNNELEWDYKLKFIENKKSTCNFFGHGKCPKKNYFLKATSFSGYYYPLIISYQDMKCLININFMKCSSFCGNWTIITMLYLWNFRIPYRSLTTTLY